MTTTIGQAFRRSARTKSIAGIAGFWIVALDLALVNLRVSSGYRLATGLGALLFYGALAGWHYESLGWRAKPRQGWLYWVKAGLIFAAIILAVGLILWGLIVAFGIEVTAWRYDLSLSKFWDWLPHSCIVAPIMEETIYRFALCSAAVAVTKPWVAILLSGFLFAALHVVYGNPGVDNVLAGFLLGWAYLKSGSLLVPIGLHAAGNFCALLLNLGAYYWVH